MLIRIENGKVADIYNGLSEDTIAQLQQAFIDSEFVQTTEVVNRGDVWPKAVVESPQPPQPPQPQTKTWEMVVMELNEIIKLAKLSLNQKKMLPENPGIYFVIGKIGSNLNLLYVGKTETTLKERWKNHHRYRDFKILEASGVEVFIAWICPDVFDSQMLPNLS